MSELDEIRSILREVAVQQRESLTRFERIDQQREQERQEWTERLARIERLVEVNSTAIAELRNENTEMRVALHEEIETVVQLITTLGEYVGQQAEQAQRDREQAERDRNQAAIDRAEFRSTVQGILDALTQRFSGNGHSNE